LQRIQEETTEEIRILIYSLLNQNGMNTSINNRYDAVEKTIFDDGLRILAIDVYQELDLMLIILNTSAYFVKKFPPIQI
jgi:hypothetical protein